MAAQCQRHAAIPHFLQCGQGHGWKSIECSAPDKGRGIFGRTPAHIEGAGFCEGIVVPLKVNGRGLIFGGLKPEILPHAVRIRKRKGQLRRRYKL